jgi:transposase
MCYSSDLPEAEWAPVALMIPPAKTATGRAV